MSNEITAYFKGTSGVSESVYQFDYGMILIIDGPDLTAPFEVHFEHTGGVDAVTAIGQDNRVAIPNACLALPGRVTAYIYDHTGQHDGQTAYVVRFQVMNRARPVDEVTDEQDSAISKAIALLAEPIDNMETIVNEALAKTGTTLSQLEAQFNAAVHAVTTDTEVTNIRVGDDGVTYPTAGQAVREQFSNLKSEIKRIGTSTEIYNLASASVSGSSAWRIDTINDVIVPQVGETYYLHIDSVTNYVDTVCARLRFRNGTTNLYYVEMTIDDVQNNRSVSTTLTNSSVDNVQLLLIRNSTASPVADGATQFSGIRITKGVDAVICIADAEFDLGSNNDFNSLKSSVNSLDNELNSFEAEAQYDLERLNIIDTKNNGFLVSSLSWLSNSYAIFFDRDVFVKSINPSFNTSGKTVVYTIAKLNTGSVQDGASYEVTDTINGTTNTALTLNRVITKNTVIRMNCSDARLNYSEIQYSRTPYPYSPKICYATGGTVSSVTSWANMRPMGVFEVYEQMPFWKTYNNYWLGKKIVWFGTSIPEGGYGGNRLASYPVMVGEKLGCAMYNEAIGSSSISRTLPSYISTNNPYGFDTTDFEFAARCLADNLTLKQWLIDNYNGGYFTTNVPSSMTDTLKNTIKNYSYERKVDRYLSGGEVGEADLYVFDQGYNDDFENRDVEALEAQYGIDTTYCFDGGMNFLIRRILTANPDAKIVIISHYTNNAPCGNQVNDSHVKAVCAAQKAVADRWGIKFINLYEQLGWSGQMIETTGYWDSTTHEWVNSGGATQQISVKNMHVRDKTHPFTDASGKSNTKIAEVLASEIESLYK